MISCLNYKTFTLSLCPLPRIYQISQLRAPNSACSPNTGSVVSAKGPKRYFKGGYYIRSAIEKNIDN